MTSDAASAEYRPSPIEVAQAMSRRTVDALMRRVETSRVLDDWATRATRKVNKVIRRGSLKNVLAGSWFGHAAHPMLTDLPIGAWTSAFALDVCAPTASSASSTLIGLGLLSTIPTMATGVTDLIDCTDRRERAIGTLHAIAGVVGAGLHGASLLARWRGHRRAGIALSGTGMLALIGAGTLGGHLSFRLGVGVDNTVFEKRPLSWKPSLADADLPEGVSKSAYVDGTEVMLRRDGAGICALANRCSHRGAPLHVGKVEDGAVTCLWHYSRFDLRDGSVIEGPATAPQPAYETRLEAGYVEIRTPQARPAT